MISLQKYHIFFSVIEVFFKNTVFNYSPMQGTFIFKGTFQLFSTFSAILSFLRVVWHWFFLLTYSPKSGEYFWFHQHVSKVISHHVTAIWSKKVRKNVPNLTFVAGQRLSLDHCYLKHYFHFPARFLYFFHLYVS